MMSPHPLPVDPPCVEHRWLPLKEGPLCVNCGLQQTKPPCRILQFTKKES
jgi:hypothetical protein